MKYIQLELPKIKQEEWEVCHRRAILKYILYINSQNCNFCSFENLHTKNPKTNGRFFWTKIRHDNRTRISDHQDTQTLGECWRPSHRETRSKFSYAITVGGRQETGHLYYSSSERNFIVQVISSIIGYFSKFICSAHNFTQSPILLQCISIELCVKSDLTIVLKFIFASTLYWPTSISKCTTDLLGLL